MPKKILTVLGALTVVVGLVVAGLAVQPSLPASAGEEPPCDSTNTPTNTPDPTATPDPTIEISGDFQAFGNGIPTCTPEPDDDEDRPTRTHTATRTVTQEPDPTNTPVPPAPTNTPVGGGVGAGGVQPPNTGSGDAAGSGVDSSLIVLGALLAIVGSGAVAMGLRRR